MDIIIKLNQTKAMKRKSRLPALVQRTHAGEIGDIKEAQQNLTRKSIMLL